MAYMSQEKKKLIAAELKTVLKGTGLKYTLGVHHHSTIVMKIKSGPIDFVGNYALKALTRREWGRDPVPYTEKYVDLNPYWYQEHFTGKALDILKKIMGALNRGNHDRSDIQSDYFDVGWYVSVKIGEYNKPYEVTQ